MKVTGTVFDASSIKFDPSTVKLPTRLTFFKTIRGDFLLGTFRGPVVPKTLLAHRSKFKVVGKNLFVRVGGAKELRLSKDQIQGLTSILAPSVKAGVDIPEVLKKAGAPAFRKATLAEAEAYHKACEALTKWCHAAVIKRAQFDFDYKVRQMQRYAKELRSLGVEVIVKDVTPAGE